MLIDELESAHSEKLLTRSDCGGLRLYHYSPHAIYNRIWTPITRMCRGLIVDSSGRIIARPFPKFFNLSEMPETLPENLPDEVPELSEKLDGSLAIVFFNPETQSWQGTTKGSFDSEQAKWINEKWLPQRTHLFNQSFTYLFELIAPWNRIVVTYDREEMVLIGIIETESGLDFSYREVENSAFLADLRRVNFENRLFHEIDFSDPTVRNREGFVARYSNGLRVKIKFDQYKQLHRIMTGLSLKGIWEVMSEGREIDLCNVPDEFMEWYRRARKSIQSEFDARINHAKRAFCDVPKNCDRKKSAMVILQFPEWIRPMLFAMLDGKDPSQFAWKLVKPDKHETFQESDE